MGAEDWLAPTGALYRFDPDRRITRMQDEVMCSNGIGWSPDGRVMYHTESFRYAIFAFDFDPNSGEINKRRPFVQLDPEADGFPDGLTVDREGLLWRAQTVSSSVGISESMGPRARPHLLRVQLEHAGSDRTVRCTLLRAPSAFRASPVRPTLRRKKSLLFASGMIPTVSSSPSPLRATS